MFNVASSNISRSLGYPKIDVYIFYIAFVFLASIGNISRLIPFSVNESQGNAAISEFIIYLISLIYFLINPKKIIYINRFVWYGLLIFTFSFFIGLFKFGFDFVALAYYVRLFLYIITISCLSFSMVRLVYRFGLYWLCIKIINFYFYGCIIGLLIFMIFPRSVDLWTFLGTIGITYYGDPHTYRFISVLLDPNFYASVAIFPFILSLYCYFEQKSKYTLMLLVLFSFTILLSGSRSGVAFYAMMIFVIFFKTVGVSLINLRFKKSWIYSFLLFLSTVILLYPLYIHSVETIIVRFSRFGEGSSAYARLVSAKFAISILQENFIFGLGYNYMASYMLRLGLLSSVDSSILGIFVTLGIPLGIFILIAVLFSCIKYFILNRIPKRRNEKILYSLMGIYILLSILFACNFNNLLFYFYWVIPVFSFSIVLVSILKPIRLNRA